MEAAIAAGKRRMRPIFLTSAAASVGVIPMILSRSPLWGPLGSVICFGLLFSMVLTLYILPILYWLMYSDRPKKPGFWSVPGNNFASLFALAAILLITVPANSEAQTLSLDSCKNLALQNNYQIKTAANEVIQSEEQKKGAFTNYFPKVGAGITLMKANDYLIKSSTPEMNLPVYDGNPANIGLATQFAYVPPIDVNLLDYMNVGFVAAVQPVFTGGQIINGNKLANAGYEISQEQEAMTVTDVLVKTDELYWTIITLNDKLKTLDGYRQLLDTLAHDVSVASKAGLTQRTDLLKVQLRQNELELNRLQLVNGINLSKKALCQHIGISYDSTLDFNSEVPQANIPEIYLQDPEAAATNRSEYRILEKAIYAEELQKKMIVGENLPQVSVGVAGLYTDMMENSQANALAFATLSIPISGWWEGSHKIKQSKAKIENAQFRLTETSELLALQIQQVQNELDETYFQIGTAQKSVDQATENLKITNSNYKAGITGMSDLLEAQASFQDAVNKLTEARCNYQIKKAKYLSTINKYE